MNSKNKAMAAADFRILVISWIAGLSLVGMPHRVAAQTTGGNYSLAQPTATISSFNAAGYEATPTPLRHHKHKNLMTGNKIPNEGMQPGKPVDGENPTITMVPVGTVEATPNSH